MASYHFYVLYSEKLDKYYIGHTGDELKERLRRHNSNHKGFTGKTDDWEVMYTEPYSTKREAHRREMQVKKWGNRQRLESLIAKARHSFQ